ncbi:MAG: leucine-rich repeat domain-containing protein [Oscillospiraceae bacterium]|nr:leucine-rich repeat domain-containing protein [Oscillospiraceae bacterium]
MKLRDILKSIGGLCAAMLLCVSAMPVAADEDSELEFDTYECGDYTYSLMVGASNKTEKAACIEKYSGEYQTSLVLPETLDGYDVVALGDTLLTQCQWLVDVTLPSTLMGLGNATFAGCTQLSNYYVAEGNPYFESVDGVLYAEKRSYLVRYPIGRKETEITVPDGVTDIGYVAFGYSPTLEKITLPDTLTNIGSWAFAECPQLNHVIVPDKVKTISDFLFYRCKVLDDVIVPDTLAEIGDAAFAGTAIAEFTIPSKCTTIGQATFAGTPMKEVTIPETVTSIDFSAFGWLMDQQGQLYANTDFIIHGVEGTVAQMYAADKENGNNFQFVPLENPSTSTSANSHQNTITTVTTAQTGNHMGMGRIIGIIACGVLLIGVIVGSILWARKK